MTTGQKWLVYLGPLIGTGIGGYLYISSSNDPGTLSVIGVSLGMPIFFVSLVGLLGAWLVTNGKLIGLLLMALSGVFSLPLLVSIPTGIYELIVVSVILYSKRDSVRRKDYSR